MKCKYSKFINKYFDGELPASLDKEVFTHFYKCSACRKKIELLKAVKGSLRKHESLKAHPNFTPEVMEQIERRFVKGWAFDVKPLALKLIPALSLALVALSFVSFAQRTKKEAPTLESVLLAENYTPSEQIVLSSEKLSEYDVFKLTLN